MFFSIVFAVSHNHLRTQSTLWEGSQNIFQFLCPKKDNFFRFSQVPIAIGYSHVLMIILVVYKKSFHTYIVENTVPTDTYTRKLLPVLYILYKKKNQCNAFWKFGSNGCEFLFLIKVVSVSRLDAPKFEREGEGKEGDLKRTL